MGYDFEQIKKDYPLRETFESILGAPVRRTRRYDLYNSPFRHDRKPSFIVYDDRCTDTAGYLINGREFADLFDFLRAYYSLPNNSAAARELTGKLPTPPIRIVLPKEDFTTISMHDVARGERHQSEAVPYFATRGLRMETIRKHRMGVYVDYTWRASDTLITTCRRYSIPDIAYGRVRNVELRRDDNDAYFQLREGLLDLKEVMKIADAWSKKHGNFPSENDFVELLFGPKYLRAAGGIHKNLIGNIEVAMQDIEYGGKRGFFCPRIPQLLVHEGLLKALVVDDAGYPSVSAKGASGLALLYGVGELIIVKDNEPDQIRPDGTKFNPGEEYARRAVEASGRRSNVRIITPPGDIKAGDDAVVGGIIHEWMKSEGIQRHER